MNLQTAEIERRIELETKAEKHIQKLLLLGTIYSGSFLIYLLHICLDTLGIKYCISVDDATIFEGITNIFCI